MDRVLATLDRLLGVCDRTFLFVANALLAAMLAANIVNILVRGIFDRGIVMVFPWTMVLFVWSVFLGFFVVYRRSQDITIGFFVERLSRRGQRAAALAVNIVVIAMTGFFVSQAPRVLSMQQGIIGMIELPRFLLSIPFFVSSLLILLDVAARSGRILLGTRFAPSDSVLGSGP